MKTWKQKRKDWHDYHCKKMNKKRKKKTSPKKILQINVQESTHNSFNMEYHVLEVPEYFSIIENTEKTLDFYLKIYSCGQMMPPKTRFYINSENVKYVSVDALVFLLASIKNAKINRKKLFCFKGNFPRNKEAFKIYVNSGFKDFFNSNMREIPKDTEKMTIIMGTQNSPISTKSVCQFVMEKLNLQRQNVMDIQKILIELMSNVYAHAYKDEEELMDPCWYIYADHFKDDAVRIVFSDTGLGITKTVRKKFMEYVFKKKDSELLESAFSTEEFRTETKKKNRGNGLPGIKDIVLNGNINNFYVFAGTGEFHIYNKDGYIFKKIEHTNRINGTLYVFDFIR